MLAPEIFDIFPNGLNRGGYILIFVKGLQGPTQRVELSPGLTGLGGYGYRYGYIGSRVRDMGI